MVEHDVDAALKAWGAHYRDDPFALFADVRRRGAVHPVTLVDGHDAWLVVRHDEARAALNDQRLSKDMHAALAADAGVVSEGLPGPAFARHMLTVDPPDHTRLRRLVSSAFSPRRIEALRPRIQAIVDDLLDGIAAEGADSRVDLVSRFAFPVPFTVICELLGVPEPDRAALGRGLTALLVPTSTAEQYAEAKLASDAVVTMLEQLVEVKTGSPGDDLVSALIAARDGNERLDTRRAALDDLPADRRRSRHDRELHRQQRRRPVAQPRPTGVAPRRSRTARDRRWRSSCASTPRSRTRRSDTPSSRLNWAE